MARKSEGGMRAKRLTGDIITYIILASMCVIWLMPFFWVIMQSFRDGIGQYISTFLPQAYTLNNYKALFGLLRYELPQNVPELLLYRLLHLRDLHFLRAGSFLLPVSC